MAIRVACAAAVVGLAIGRLAAEDSFHFNPVWLSPTKEPGASQGGFPTYQGAMPVGNGAFTALAWANVSNGGVGVLLGHQSAMSSATELFKLGLIQVALTPNPFLSGPFFNQTLDISTATVLVYAGGSSLADHAVSFRVWVDANADGLYIDVASGDGTTPYALTASIESLRPSKPYTYSVPFASCTPVGSQPDVFVDPVPGPTRLSAPAPLPQDARFRHASAVERPSRVLIETGVFAPGASVGLLAGSVIQYHRNNASDGLTVEATLGQQGLSSLVATTPDWWQDLQFGFALDSGSGPALARSSPTLLSSTAPAAAFSLRATAVAVQVTCAGTPLHLVPPPLSAPSFFPSPRADRLPGRVAHGSRRRRHGYARKPASCARRVVVVLLVALVHRCQRFALGRKLGRGSGFITR